jgi:hypothetical protein
MEHIAMACERAGYDISDSAIEPDWHIRKRQDAERAKPKQRKQREKEAAPSFSFAGMSDA